MYFFSTLFLQIFILKKLKIYEIHSCNDIIKKLLNTGVNVIFSPQHINVSFLKSYI